MTRQVVQWILVINLLMLVGCERQPAVEATATPTAAATEVAAVAATSTVTPAPLPTVAVPTPTTEPTQTPLPTPTSLPTATPFPVIRVLVRTADGEQPLPGARALLRNEEGYDASFRTGESAIATFAGVEPSAIYTLTVTADGYIPATMELAAEAAPVQVTVNLEKGVTGTAILLTNVRGQPRFDAEQVAQLEEGAVVTILAVSAGEEWLQVQTAAGQAGWVFAELLDVEGDLADVGLNAPLLTPTPVTTPPPAATATATVTVTTTATLTPTPDSTGTATPTAAGELPPRPAPVAFTASAFVENLEDLQVTLETLGGILDQTSGGEINCEAYRLYYGQVNTITTYNNVPEAWQGFYDLYVAVADNVLASNEDLYLWCQAGGGQLSAFNRNIARSGILNNLLQLIPAIEQAALLLDE